MVSFRRNRATWLLLAATLAMTGCQASPASAPRPTVPVVRLASPAAAIAYPLQLELQQAQTSNDPMAALELTDAQRRQLAAIPMGDQPDQSAEYRRILLAPQVDKVALKALLTPTEAALDASIKWQVAMREILTPKQRQQLIALMKQQPASREDTLGQKQVPDDVRKRLGLTPEQERAFSAMNQALEAYHRATQARMQAVSDAFMTSGDAGALRQAGLEHARGLPLDAMVDFFASLTQAQRKQLFEQPQGEAGQTS